MPLSDAGKFVWNGGANSYIFTKDFTSLLPLSTDTQEDVKRAADGSLRTYSSTKIKLRVELEFEEVGATQRNQMATIWKQRLSLDFYPKQTDAAKMGTFWWAGDFDFRFSQFGIIYKNLWSGRITLEEI